MRRKWVVLPGRHPATVRQALDGIRGVYFDRLLMRFYPRGAIAAEFLGLVTVEGQALSGTRARVRFGAAWAARAARFCDAMQRSAVPGALQELLAPVSGRDIVLTIDADLQEIAREALAHALRQTGAVSGDMLMADPRTGEILAAVSSKPGGRNWRAVTEPYEPGSTLKPFIVATLLAEKKADLTDSVFAENGNYTTEAASDQGCACVRLADVADALKHSSNIVMAKLSERLDAARNSQYLRGFGFGSPTAFTYPCESGGLLRRPDNWSRLLAGQSRNRLRDFCHAVADGDGLRRYRQWRRADGAAAGTRSSFA